MTSVTQSCLSQGKISCLRGECECVCVCIMVGENVNIPTLHWHLQINSVRTGKGRMEGGRDERRETVLWVSCASVPVGGYLRVGFLCGLRLPETVNSVWTSVCWLPTAVLAGERCTRDLTLSTHNQTCSVQSLHIYSFISLSLHLPQFLSPLLFSSVSLSLSLSFSPHNPSLHFSHFLSVKQACLRGLK